MILRLPLPWTRNIGMNSDPSTRADCHKATPYNAPNGATMCEVGAMI